MKIIRALLFLSSLGGMASATTIIQTKTKIAYLAGNLGAMTFARFDTSLGKLRGVSVGFSFSKNDRSLALDHDDSLLGSILFCPNLEAYITSSTVGIGSAFIDKNTLAHSSTSFTVGGDRVADDDTFDIVTSDDSVYSDTTKNTTFATENIDSDSWTHHVGTGTYEIDFRPFNGMPPRE